MLTRLVAILALPTALAAQTCAPHAPEQAAARARAFQQQLLSASVEDMDTDVPPALKPVLHTFKQSLIATVDLGFRCNPTLTDPAALQAGIAGLLHANRPQPATPPASPAPKPPANEPQRSTGVYGDDLTVKVLRIPGHSDLLSAQLAYSIACGEDNLLLLYRRTATGWERALVYANPDLNTVGDAVGDFFFWALVPGPAPNAPALFAAAHGTPWCTSRLSAFHVDLLTLASVTEPQKTLAHRNDSYSRDADDPRELKLTHDGFQLRVQGDSLDFDQLFIRPRVYRFRTTAGTLERLQPFADNARDFVDVWLQLPWQESEKWVEGDPARLQSVHDRLKEGSMLAQTLLTYGPVRACTGHPGTFQVATSLGTASPATLSTGSPATHEQLYVHVRQDPTAYVVLNTSAEPDPACNGPDLMVKSGHKQP